MTMHIDQKLGPSSGFLLSELLRCRILATVQGKPKKLGKLKDLIIVEVGPLPHVTEIIVKRGFGLPDLLIPIELVGTISTKGITVNIQNPVDFEKPVAENALLLADYVLDKKVIDLEGREISVVFDVRLLLVDNLRKMYVTDVEFGKKGMYRRLGLKWLADHVAEEDVVSWSYIQPLPESIGSFKGDVQLKAVKENLNDMPPVDLADIIEELDSEQRTEVFMQLDEESASDTLEELEPHVQRQLVSELEPATVARLIDQMTPPQAADIMAILPYEDKQSIIKLLDPELAAKIQSILEKQEESILHYATDRFIALPQTTLVGYVEDNYAQLAREMDVTMYVYILNQEQELVGVMDIKEILLADNANSLSQVMNESVVSLEPDNTLRDAYESFLRYGYRAIPILNLERQVLGVIKYRDVINLKHRFVG